MPTPIGRRSRSGTLRAAETLYLIDADESAPLRAPTDVVHAFREQYERDWLKGMRVKLGLVSEDEADLNLATGFSPQWRAGKSTTHWLSVISPMRP